MRLRAFCIALISALATSSLLSAQEPASPPAGAPPLAPPSLGLLIEAPDVASLPQPGEQPAVSTPPYARLVARWPEIEREKGVYDWSSLDPAVSALHGAGLRVVVCLTGGNDLYLPAGKTPSPIEGESLQAWTSFTRSAVRAFAGKVAAIEVWDGPAAAFEPSIYAFVLKSSALAIRAESRAEGVEIAVAQGALDADALDWQKALWEQDTAAYVDVLPVRLGVGGAAPSPVTALSAIVAETLLHPPAPKVWAYLEPAADAEPGASLFSAVTALESSVSAAFGRVSSSPEVSTAELEWVRGLQRLLAEGFAPAPAGQLSFLDTAGNEMQGPRVLGRFLREKDLSALIVYRGAPDTAPGTQGNLVLPTADATHPRVVDPRSGQEYASAALRVPGGGARTALGVLFTDHPMALLFERAADVTGLDSRQQVEIKTVRGLTAEEIIARYQAVQKVQDDRLERWTARGRIEYHYKLAQAGSTIDVAIDANYFWERGGALEWEQTNYYVNGNLVRWKNIPEMPLIQPEKVVTIPLDLTLDRTYLYRLVGEDTIDGSPVYVLAFEPADPDAPQSLYRGRVWIDKQTFVRRKAAIVQTNLEPPVTSNDETDFYTQVEAEGGPYWMLSRTVGEQLWTVGGRNLVVRRDVTLESFTINPPQPDFEAGRRTAYESPHQVLRETEHGYRYLERQEDGTRVVREKLDTSQFFAAGGAFKDSSFDTPVPLAGVSYLNYDMWGENVQLNILFAGVLALLNVSKPELFGTRMDFTMEGTGLAIKTSDKVYVAGEEVVPETIETRRQSLSARLGIPMGNFVRITAIGNVVFNSYFEGDDTDPAFVLPENHEVLTGTLQAELNRNGYSLTLSGSQSTRSDWSAWGLPGGEGQPPAFDPAQKSFSTWGATAFKEWYLPKFQKLRGEIDFLDGTDLDRFSRYAFSSFGDSRLNGFSGTGVRFDRGTIARAGYSFNLFQALRLDASVESASVQIEDDPAGSQRFTGAGLSAGFVGPWKTVWSVSYGRALASDIDELVGKQEFLLLVLKLF
jgi:hypothetical protein